MNEMLISLAVIMMMLPMITAALGIVRNTLEFSNDIQDVIALQQLRDKLLIADSISCENSELRYTTAAGEWRLHQSGENLILQPGTQFILTEIDEVSFEENGGVYYAVYERNGRVYKEAIASE